MCSAPAKSQVPVTTFLLINNQLLSSSCRWKVTCQVKILSPQNIFWSLTFTIKFIWKVIFTLYARCIHFDYARWAAWSHLSPHLLQLFERMRQRCFAVTVLICFADYKTSPDSPLACRRVENDGIFIFGWTCALIATFSHYCRCSHMTLMSLAFSWEFGVWPY